MLFFKVLRVVYYYTVVRFAPYSHEEVGEKQNNQSAAAVTQGLRKGTDSDPLLNLATKVTTKFIKCHQPSDKMHKSDF